MRQIFTLPLLAVLALTATQANAAPEDPLASEDLLYAWVCTAHSGSIGAHRTEMFRDGGSTKELEKEWLEVLRSKYNLQYAEWNTSCYAQILTDLGGMKSEARRRGERPNFDNATRLKAMLKGDHTWWANDDVVVLDWIPPTADIPGKTPPSRAYRKAVAKPSSTQRGYLEIEAADTGIRDASLHAEQQRLISVKKAAQARVKAIAASATYKAERAAFMEELHRKHVKMGRRQ